MARPSAVQVRERAEWLWDAVFDDAMPADTIIKEFEKQVEQALISTMYYWFDTIYPTNFEVGAADRRGYKPRSRSYNSKKFKMTAEDGIARPAEVYSGEATKPAFWKNGRANRNVPNWKDMTTSNPASAPRMERKGYGYDGVISVNIPLYVRQNRSIPQMAKEVTRLTDEDLERMDLYFNTRMLEWLGI